MGYRMKEEDKIERIIRGLLKLPENKRCINCNSLGPQYVCTTFLTFVCTNCSGVHREFTHRVKSVSMARFKAEEVSSLQAGGNERARQIYFKEFDPQYHTYPDGSNVNRLRDFIKHVYIDRKYTGERSMNNLPRLRLSEEPYESRLVNAFHGGSKSFRDDDRSVGGSPSGSRSFRDEDRKVGASPGGSRSFRDEDRKVGASPGGSRRFHEEEWKVIGHHGGSRSFSYQDDRYEQNYSQGSSPGVRGVERNPRYCYEERRSPRYYQENSRNVGSKRTPIRFEIVDNRIRDDRKARSGLTSGESKLQSTPPVNKKNDSSSSPVVRSVKEKLGENMLPPLSGESLTANDQKHADDSAHDQRNKSASCHDGDAVEHKKGNVQSLIDFNTDPGPPQDAVELQPQQTPPQPRQTPPPNDSSNWASFESSKKEVSQVPKQDTLEALLLELSPATVPEITAAETPKDDDALSIVCTNTTPPGGDSHVAPVDQMLTLFDSDSTCTSASTSTAVPVQTSNTLTSTSVPVQPSNAVTLPALPASGGDITAADTTVPTQSSNEGPLPPPPKNSGDTAVKVINNQQDTQQIQSSICFPVDSGCTSEQTSTPVEDSKGLLRTSSLAPNTQESFSISAETPSQSVLRSQSLPPELNSSKREELPVDLFAIPAQVSGWIPPHEMGFNMQYNPNTTPPPAFPVSRKPFNPFDLNESVGHSTHFPSMSSVEAALHNTPVPPGPMHTSNFGTYASHLRPPQSPANEFLMYSQSLPSFASPTPRTYTGEQLHSDVPILRPQGMGGLSHDEAAGFGSLSTSHQPFQQPNIIYPTPSSSESFTPAGGNPFD